MRKVVCVVFLLVLALILTLGILSSPAPADRAFPSASREAAARARLAERFGKLPLYFVENRGQLDPRVAYSVHGRDTAIYFAKEGITFSLIRAEEGESSSGRLSRASFGKEPFAQRALDRRWNVKLDFLDANPDVQVVGTDRTAAVISYFKGSREEWKTGLPTYSSVLYRELWPGIDLLYSGTVDRLKYQFVVKPGADPERIRLSYSGASQVRVSNGALEVETPLGGFSDDRPYSYQEINGRQVEVGTEYALSSVPGPSHSYGFRLGTYDKSRPLVIDPAVLVYAGFIGGSGSDVGRGIAVDASGNAYVTGQTASTEATFPETGGPDLTFNGQIEDAFVAKVTADGTSLVYAGYIGGSGRDLGGTGIAVDGSGNAYVTGDTESTEATFPVTVGPDLTYNGGRDAFVAKVNAAGTSLVYAGYIGGSTFDQGLGIAVDGSGNAYVSGQADSSETTGFPVLGGPDLTHGGFADAFVAKVNAAGTSLVYAGFIGGLDFDRGDAIAVDGSGNAYVAGVTRSTDTTFPEVVGPDLVFNGGLEDGFVAKVNAAGTSLVYAGYIGGAGSDVGRGIAVDGSGNAYVTGNTDSTEATFPVTGGPDLTSNGGNDAFVAKVNAAGTSLVYAGYIGGSVSDVGAGIALDGFGNAYVTGNTGSTEATFPVTDGPDLTSNGGSDAFVAKVSAAGTSLVYAGYIGGGNTDAGNGIAVDGSGNAYVTGETNSDEATFPETVGPDLTFNLGGDAFVAKVSEGVGLTPTPTSTPTATATQTPTSTPTLTNTPVGVATATPTPTPTSTLTPTIGIPTSTSTPTPPLPTSTPTFTPPTGQPAANVPTLSFPMLLLLGLGLAVTALFLVSRT